MKTPGTKLLKRLGSVTEEKMLLEIYLAIYYQNDNTYMAVSFTRSCVKNNKCSNCEYESMSAIVFLLS